MTKKRKQKLKTRQKGGWINRYHFAFSGRDSICSKHCKPSWQSGSERNSPNHKSGRKRNERVAPIVIKKTIEELYKSPFCLLGDFGRQKYNAPLRKLKKNLF